MPKRPFSLPPAGGPVGQLAAAGAEALLLLIAAEAVLLVDPYAWRWADFISTTHLWALTPLLALLAGICWWAERQNTKPVGAGLKPAPTAGETRRWTPATFFALALAAVTLTTALSTSFSIAPQTSLWGDQRLTTGLLSVLAWIVVCGAAATVLRSWSQVERLLRTLLLTALSATLFGFMGVLGLNPLTTLPARVERAGSTLGNPIFLGSLLVLVLPLALAWLWLAMRSTPPQENNAAPSAPGERAAKARPGTGTGAISRAPTLRQRRAPGEVRARLIAPLLWVGVLLCQQALFFIWLLLASARPDAAWLAPAVLAAFVWLGVLLAPPRLPPGMYRRDMSRLYAALGLGLLACALLALLLLTRARGPFLGAGVAVALLVVWMARPAWRRWAVAVLPALGVALAVASIALGSALVGVSSLVSGRSSDIASVTVESRLLIWRTVWSLVATPDATPAVETRSIASLPGASAPRLLVGYGPDTLRLISEPVYPLALRAIEPFTRLTSSHNDLLDHLVTVGLLGTAAWLALIASVLFAARVAYRRADARQRILLGGVLAGLLGYAVEQTVAPAYPPVRTLAWLLGGAIVGLARGTANQEPQPAPRGPSPEGRGLGWPLGFAAVTFAAALALPPASPPDELLATATGWWLWALVGIAGLGWALAPPAARRLRPRALLLGVLPVAIAATLVASQALRPLVAERLGSAAEGASETRDYAPAVMFAAVARAAWPVDERYDLVLGTRLIELAGAPSQPGGRLPQRLPAPSPPPEPFGPAAVAQATPERLLDWGVWLVDRAAERQPLEFDYPLARAALYQRLAEQFSSPEALAEARRSLAAAQALSPTSPRVRRLAAELGQP